MAKLYCNKCGKGFGFEENQDANEDFSIHTIIGYGSKYDECYLDLNLCSSCMDELIDQCAISPIYDPEDNV